MSKTKLPLFLYNALKYNNTSLGNNGAIPKSEEIPYEYTEVKKRYEEVISKMHECNPDITNVEEAETELSRLIRKTMDIEKPLRPQLEKVCENIVNKVFAIPQETVQISCKLVDSIEPKHAYRIMPESEDGEKKYTFEDAEEARETNKEILKRRFVDSLIQGGAYVIATQYDIESECSNLDKDIIELYARIYSLNDYILFSKEAELSDDSPSQGSYVSVNLGSIGEKVVINSQGLIFPLLLQETLRGLLELFSANSLPEDTSKAMYVIRKSDFLLAEPWDLRIGVPLWKNMFSRKDIDTTYIPYIFSDLCGMEIPEFNETVKNILLSTKKGERFIKDEIKSIIHNSEYNEFIKNIEQKNAETSLILDKDMSSEDIENYELTKNIE